MGDPKQEGGGVTKKDRRFWGNGLFQIAEGCDSGQTLNPSRCQAI